MNSTSGRRGLPRPDRLALLGAALVAAFAAPVAGAQNLPYQSQQREAVGAGFGQIDPPQGLFLEPRVEAAGQYAYNINLATTSAAQDNALGVEVAPGFYASYNSDHFHGAVDYSLIARAWDDHSYDDLGHNLAGNGRWVAVPDLIYVDADASYQDVLIDSSKGLNYGSLGVFGQNNLVEQATASVSPTLLKRFRMFEFEAGYSYGRVWYLDPGKSQAPTGVAVISNDDSVDQDAHVRFGTARADRKLNGAVFYEWNYSEYDVAVPYKYERAGFDGSFLMTRSISLVGDVGQESSLDESTTAGGFGSEFWSAGLRWTPDARTSVEGRFGERFFGTSYSGSITHRAKLVELTASYTEAPNVQTRQLALGQFDPGTLPPGFDPGLDGGRLNAQPYVGKDARVGITARGSRTMVALNVWDTRRDFLRNAFGDEQGSGVTLVATRQVASNFSVDASAAYDDIEREGTFALAEPILASHDYDTQFILRANRDFGPKLTASLETGWLSRAGTTDYDGWWVGLRGRWIPSLH